MIFKIKKQKIFLFVFSLVLFYLILININGLGSNIRVLPFYNKTNLNLNDILIVIKSSDIYYSTRLKNIIETWYRLAPEHIYAVTDSYSSEFNAKLDGKLVYTNCGSFNKRKSQCCKLGTELSLYFSLKRSYEWFCHVDDDNYINLFNLNKFLMQYDSNKDWYIGRASWNVAVDYKTPENKNVSFWFGTLGAGMCLSKKTMEKLRDFATAKWFTNECERLSLPDDMYLGYLLETKLGISLTNSELFNHHLDIHQFDNLTNLKDKITLGFGESYETYYDKYCNCQKKYQVVPKLANIFDNDPLRFKTIHCLLFPDGNDYCKHLLKSALIKIELLENF